MNPVDLAFMPALEQARLIQKKEISPLELVELYLERIGRLDPQLGSYVTVVGDRALAEARAKTEQLAGETQDLPPFFGVPIPIKDLNPVEGIPCSYGVRWLKKRVATYDDGVVQRIKQAGFIILGKTATSEVGMLPYTEPDGFPPTRNPWNLDYTSGGSSGGAAAALAAGLCPIAQGSDGGGSIRGPASCCGLVGLKPSRGRITQAPVGERLGGIAIDGPLAHTITDAAALLDVLSGYTTGDPYWLPDPDPSFLTVAQQGLPNGKSLRIAFSADIPPIAQADSHCRQAVMDTVRLLESLGHQVEEGCPDFEGLVEPFTKVIQTNVDMTGIPFFMLGRLNRWFKGRGQRCSSGKYLRALYEMQVVARKIVKFFDQFDVLVLPTYLHPPIRVREWARLGPNQTLEKITDWIAPCPPFNATGQPALSLPLAWTPEGLPIGVQFVARPAAEATLIALAAQIEQAQPWGDRRPAFAT